MQDIFILYRDSFCIHISRISTQLITPTQKYDGILSTQELLECIDNRYIIILLFI